MKPTPRSLHLLAMFTLALAMLAAPQAPARAGVSAGSPDVPRVVMTSPVAGGRWLPAATGILVRFDRDAGLAGARLDGLVGVTGSASGAHAGRTHLSRDGSALLFDPAVPFAPGESVTVSVSPAAAPEPGPLGASRAFTFHVAAAEPPAQAALADLALPALSELAAAGPAPAPAHAFTLESLPADFPALGVQQYGNTAPGYLFAASMDLGGGGTPYLMILDQAGSPVWFQRTLGGSCTDFKRQENGQISYFDPRVGCFAVMDSTMAYVDRWTTGNGYATDLHDLRLLPNGHALLMSYDRKYLDLTQVVPGGLPSALVTGLVIQEQDQDKNVVFQWRSWDHFSITDAINQNLLTNIIDYCHGNALELDGDGNLLLSSRNMCEITKIDRITGAVIWRWGGLHNQFAFVGDTLEFSCQHGIRRLANGHYVLFDNGNYHVPSFSRACEYVLDQVNHTATLVWSYRNTPDSYGFAMGYVQRLGNGNTLISYGTGKPDAIEVTPAGTRVMELDLPAGIGCYRTYRDNWNPPPAAVGGPDAPLELALLGPNPVRGSTTLLARIPRAGTVGVTLFDLQGRVVGTPLPVSARPAGVLSVPVSLTGRPAGVYFCRLQAGERSVVRRLLLAD